jgi:mannosyltransferase
MKQTGRIPFAIGGLSIASASLVLRIVYIEDRAIWFDEASSWLTAQLPFAQLTDSLSQSTHVPLYYPMLRMWMGLFGDSPSALRGFSVLFGMLTVAGCGLLGSRIINAGSERMAVASVGSARGFGLFCAALCGLNAFQVHASVEARMYSLGMFLAVASTVCTLRLLQHGLSRRTWLLLCLVTIASLYTHHLLAVTAFVQAAWLASHLRAAVSSKQSGGNNDDGFQSARRYWLISVSVVLLAWIPGLLLCWQQFHRIRQGFWISPMELWTLPRTCLEFLVSPPPGLWWEFRYWGIPAAFFLSVVLIYCWREGNSMARLLVLQSVVPMIVIALISLRTPLWEARYFRFAHVSLLMCVSVFLWQPTTLKTVRRIVVAVSLILSAVGTIYFWHWRDISHRTAMRGATAFIATNDAPQMSRVVVGSPTEFIIAKYYANQLGWPVDRVKLWTGHDSRPGAARHLVTTTDWWKPNEFREIVWLIENVETQNPLLRSKAPWPSEGFRSDHWLDSWTVRVARVAAADIIVR